MARDESDPPRRPLRVWMSATYTVGEGTSIEMTGWRILDPEDPDYDTVYYEAVRASQATGQPMPYAGDARGVSSRGPENSYMSRKQMPAL